jgi:hypothetical protein
MGEIRRVAEKRDGTIPKSFCEWCWEQTVGLITKIDDGFCGVIPASIFEIHKAQLAAGLQEGVVKSEIGWR